MATRTRSTRDSDSTAPVRTIFLRGGAASRIHRHDEAAAWIHVVSGSIVEERWRRDPEGGFVHERRVLRKGQSMAAPADALHRVSALEDAAFVTTCACDCARAKGASPSEIDTVIRLSRTGDDHMWATSTVLGADAPR
jgi:quercetin dioxygenase-like cupin family protein